MAKTTAKKQKNMLLIDFAKRVRQHRYSLGLTQEQLAERAGVHINYVGSIERAQRNPSLICITAIAKALEISPKDLISDSLDIGSKLVANW